MTEARLFERPASGSAPASALFLTHECLVLRGRRWARKTVRCKAVLAEPGYGYPSERPDVIGWTNRYSVVVECKATRADFLRDRRKPGRRREMMDGPAGGGLGDERWYLTPRGLIDPEELPEGWGLLEIHGSRVHRIVQAPRRPPHPERLLRERHILASCLAAVQRRDAGGDLIPTRHLERNLGTGGAEPAEPGGNGRPS